MVKVLLALAALATLLVAVCVGVALILAVRSLLRVRSWAIAKTQRVRERPAREALLLGGVGALGRLRDPGEFMVLRERALLRHAVASAARSVEVADRAGAPLGELPDLLARLSGHAFEVDRRLVVCAQVQGDERERAIDEAREVVGMARQVQLAAVEAHAAVTGLTTSALSAQANDVIAGVRAAAAWLRRRSYPPAA